MRIGWDNPKNVVNIAKHAEDAGVSAVFVHGRTRMQGYRSPVDYSAIRKVKEALQIPVIASGDIWSARTAKGMFDLTGCDAITIARGALGNPWIFNEINEFLARGRILSRPGVEAVALMMKHHLNLGIDFYGEKTGVMKFRKFYIWYTRGFRRTKPLRVSVSSAGNKLEMYRLIDEFTAIALI